MSDPSPEPTVVPDADELKERLTPLQFEVTQNAGTERAFTGEYWDCHDDGVYHCIVCDAALFSSDTKFESGSGWPSFYAALDDANVTLVEDRSHGMLRTEVPQPTGDRFCMNSASLKLEPS